ncbi:MAG: hypothetical protein R3B82_06790 [Sandaracinaceae bacterium]
MIAVSGRARRRARERCPTGGATGVEAAGTSCSPTDWERHGIVDPTVAAVWFEKKRSKPLNVVLPTVVLSPHAELVVDAIGALQLPAERVRRDQYSSSS